MKISIVTPSYNQGKFIEQTINSVLSQKGNFYLQYIVMDGGSTDNTISVLKKTEERFQSGIYKNINLGSEFIWISKKDNGQSDALNNGFKKADGDIFGYINSDDYYLPNTLNTVSQIFKKNIDYIYGDTIIENSILKTKRVNITGLIPYPLLSIGSFFPSDSTFWRKVIHGTFKKEYHFAMDYDFLCRVFYKRKGRYYPDIFSVTRIHDKSKTTNMIDVCKKESAEIISKYFGNSYWNRRYGKVLIYYYCSLLKFQKKLLFNFRYKRYGDYS